MLVRAITRLNRICDSIASSLSSSFRPPVSPALALVEPSSSYGVEDIVKDMRILLGVPKFRTSKPKKVTRKFSITRIFHPKTDHTACISCGSYHQIDTICGVCYEKVRQATNEIKKAMMNYNPYKGEKQDKEVHVRYQDDATLEDGVLNGKRVLEIDKPRPSWFKIKFDK